MPRKRPSLEPYPYAKDEYESAGSRILAELDKPRPCFCIGPQNGEPFCPCMMRAQSASEDAMRAKILDEQRSNRERKRRTKKTGDDVNTAHELITGKNVRYTSGERGVLLWFDDEWVLVRHHGADAPSLWMREGTRMETTQP